MPKHYKEMIDELINKMDEDAPTNAVAHGGVDMNPTGRRVKKKTDVGTTADAENKIRELIMKKFGKNVKENTDNNNVVLRGINETLNKLEDKIDEMNKVLPQLRTFILPGGDVLVSYCHIARTVCRRAERWSVELIEKEELDEIYVRYLNRMSDFLFVLARYFAHNKEVKEIPWIPKK